MVKSLPEQTSVPASDRKRSGRPLLSDADRRRHHVGFYVTSSELTRLDARATAAGLSVSAFCRTLIESDAPRPQRRGGRIVPDIAGIVVQLAQLGNNLNQLLREARYGHFPASTNAAVEEAAKAVASYLHELADADGSET